VRCQLLFVDENAVVANTVKKKKSVWTKPCIKWRQGNAMI